MASTNGPISATTLAVQNKVYIDRVLTDYGYVPKYPIINVTIGVSNTKPIFPEPGFIIDALTVQDVFNRLIRSRYDRRTLVQEGEPVPPEIKYPPAFVPFSPSLEQTSRYFYNILRPVFTKLGVRLDFVAVTTPIATARFTGQGIL
ncbi:hypothetical protein A374_06396 [Fictibacillus macauensis ZFHKF-1]|uniref:6-carboxy-5,6,7,8-tetrahydropterin synthase n=1 Tax=Fictibacillus macauensis ZFHKF-1 TaxID=1196324 RepID=I8AK51_9BACL|nr:6-carboxytetrahydropterin synthase [Fictibacillus macauensis]EIT86207.1 hypothetical protein A374_06396 [Fictibacillus macauensis ZFHKF-1]